MSFLTKFANRFRVQSFGFRLLNTRGSHLASELSSHPLYLPQLCRSIGLPDAGARHYSTNGAAVVEEESMPYYSSPRDGRESEAIGSDSALSDVMTTQVRVPVSADDNVPKTLRYRKWNWWSRRTGLVAVKLGMTQLWNKEGFPVAVTVLQVIDNQVVMVRTKQKDGYFGLQIGAHDNPKLKNVPRHMQGQFSKAGVSPKHRLSEFVVSQDALLPVGTSLYAGHFYPGQYVDVCSKSIGKGFQGVMKRHGMKGQPASHGVTKTHRKMGATGGGQDPGRIWPGKKMPGRMGGKRVTTQNLKVYRVNNRFNVLYVHGPVPGHKNTYVRVTDAKRQPHKTPPPFPTYIPDSEKTLPEESYSDDIHLPHEGTIQFADKRRERRRR